MTEEFGGPHVHPGACVGTLVVMEDKADPCPLGASWPVFLGPTPRRLEAFS